MIPAHGGRLIHRIATGAHRDELVTLAKTAPRLTLNAREVADLESLSVLPGLHVGICDRGDPSAKNIVQGNSDKTGLRHRVPNRRRRAEWIGENLAWEQIARRMISIYDELVKEKQDISKDISKSKNG